MSPGDGQSVSNEGTRDANSPPTAQVTFNVTTGYQVGGTQVVGARITGWGTSTGGARGAVAAGTATLPQTAAALAQLIEDLKTHGLLGA